MKSLAKLILVLFFPLVASFNDIAAMEATDDAAHIPATAENIFYGDASCKDLCIESYAQAMQDGKISLDDLKKKVLSNQIPVELAREIAYELLLHSSALDIEKKITFAQQFQQLAEENNWYEDKEIIDFLLKTMVDNKDNLMSDSNLAACKKFLIYEGDFGNCGGHHNYYTVLFSSLIGLAIDKNKISIVGFLLNQGLPYDFESEHFESEHKEEKNEDSFFIRCEDVNSPIDSYILDFRKPLIYRLLENYGFQLSVRKAYCLAGKLAEKKLERNSNKEEDLFLAYLLERVFDNESFHCTILDYCVYDCDSFYRKNIRCKDTALFQKFINIKERNKHLLQQVGAKTLEELKSEKETE